MCELCHNSHGHDPRCPYYTPSEDRDPTGDTCVICGEPIYEGELILINGDDHFHKKCFCNTPVGKLIEALSFEEEYAGY